VSKELFSMEREHGRVVRYPESYTVPKMKMTLDYLKNLNVISFDEISSTYKLEDVDKVNYMIEKFARDVNDQVSINLKFNQGE
jgi:hypothetical protein